MKEIPSRINVLAGWLENRQKIGTCFFEHTRGNEVVSFMYDSDWLVKYPDFELGFDIHPVSSRQYPLQGHSTFGFISDASPDRWGRTLMQRFDKENKVPGKISRTLCDSDYLLRVYDRGRQGGLIFTDDDGYVFSTDNNQIIPPITELRTLEEIARKIELGNSSSPKWLKELIAPGSSLGGARPKANIIDTDGAMWIAKFPSKYDAYNVGAWEMLSHDLMVLCGIKVSDAKLVNLSEYGSTFLTKRFDRYINDKGNESRYHFSSAMNFLGRTDNDTIDSSYLDILGLIEKHGGRNADVEINELWNRLIFNICIGNTDDHLRNHGFIFDGKEWSLSPAYDVNPNPDKMEHSLCIDFDSKENNLERAFQICGFFRKSKEEAEKSIIFIQKSVEENWGRLAAKYGVTNEINYIKDCFKESGRLLF